ncbi:TonB-dependent receptor [Bergeyella sp. RCAD1439]|uniref:TonB-dependent receptor n=1 Tax=Bergeyella anatis TaxID=3113737 RepID=UPI002E16F7C2|nr:TonB-dependent receptor [Bergeyella sp. RCAD1439]
MNRNIQLLPLFLLGISQTLWGQIQEERLVLERQRVPEVKAIEKKKTSVASIKNYPPEEKTQNPVKYIITNVPAVSDFKTSTLQGEDISPKIETTHQNNYVRAGYGNYGRFLADGHLSTLLDNKMEVGTDFHYYSTEGLKKDYPWSSRTANATLDAFVNHYGEKGKFNVTAQYERNDYNYYGIYALAPSSDVDLKQKTNQIRVNGYYDFYSNDILNDIRVNSHFLADHYDARENQFSASVNLSKHAIQWPWDEITLNADLGLGMNARNTTFSLLNRNTSNLFSMEAAPKITFYKGDSYLRLGSGFALMNYRINHRDLTQAETTNKFYWFPQAEALFAASDEFKFYAGVDGGLTDHSYASLLESNPFLVSDQLLRPTETKYHFYFGLKGDISRDFKYDVKAGYGKMRNIMFFRANPLFDDVFTLNRSAYNYANTFSAVYDDGNISTIKGSLQYFPLQNLALDAELAFTKYDLKNYENIYNVPLLNLSFGGKYTLLEKKLGLGAKVFFVTDRTTNSFSINELQDGLGNRTFASTEQFNAKVGGYVDINLSAEYKIHKNFSIFALGNNLMAAKYQTYKGYKVLGAQVLGGVKITF